jgi:hypothetical protein
MLPKYPHHIQAGFFLPTGAWQQWRQAGIATVAERVRRLDPIFAAFADSLQDFQAFFPLAGQITLVKDWARHGLLLIGDAAHTMSPAGAIGKGSTGCRGPRDYPCPAWTIAQDDLATVQQLREGDAHFAPFPARGSACYYRKPADPVSLAPPVRCRRCG